LKKSKAEKMILRKFICLAANLLKKEEPQVKKYEGLS